MCNNEKKNKINKIIELLFWYSVNLRKLVGKMSWNILYFLFERPHA